MQNLMVTINSITTDSSESVELVNGLSVPVSFKTELDNAITSVMQAKFNLVCVMAYAIAQTSGTLTKKEVQASLASYLKQTTTLKEASIKDYLTDANNISLMVVEPSLDKFKSSLTDIGVTNVSQALLWQNRNKEFDRIRGEFPISERANVIMKNVSNMEELSAYFKELRQASKVAAEKAAAEKAAAEKAAAEKAAAEKAAAEKAAAEKAAAEKAAADKAADNAAADKAADKAADNAAADKAADKAADNAAADKAAADKAAADKAAADNAAADKAADNAADKAADNAADNAADKAAADKTAADKAAADKAAADKAAADKAADKDADKDAGDDATPANVQAVLNSLKTYSDEDLNAIIYGLKDLLIAREQVRHQKFLAQQAKKKRRF